MTAHDLHTIVHDHVSNDEPPFRLSPDETIGRGRRALRRRRAVTGAAVAALAAVSVVAVPQLVGEPSGSSDNRVLADSPAYDASQMPRLIDEHARAVFAAGNPALPDGVRTVSDSQGNDLAKKYWGKASQMTVVYSTPEREFRISLLHARSEAEGDRDDYCHSELSSGQSLACETSDVDGHTVVSQTVALRRTRDGMWAVVPEKQLGSIDPARLWFQRRVEDVRSETLVVDATETVKAPRLDAVDWQTSTEDLTGLATDPDLDTPEPPSDENGCAWTLPGGSAAAANEQACVGRVQRVDSP